MLEDGLKSENSLVSSEIIKDKTNELDTTNDVTNDIGVELKHAKKDMNDIQGLPGPSGLNIHWDN